MQNAKLYAIAKVEGGLYCVEKSKNLEGFGFTWCVELTAVYLGDYRANQKEKLIDKLWLSRPC